MKHKISFNLSYTQKLPEMDSAWSDFNGTFQNFELDSGDIIELIKRGHPYTTHHHTYRQKENFVCGQHLSLDFDTEDINSTFFGILRDQFISQYAYALYTTPSHTPDTPRSRVLFLLDRSVYEQDRYKLLAEGLVHKYQTADTKCKDVCRFFWGSGTGGEMKVIGNILPTSLAYLKIGQPYQRWKDAHAPKPNPNAIIITPQQANGSASKLKDSLLQNLYNCPRGQRHDTLLRIGFVFGGYIEAGYFHQDSIEREMYNAIAANYGNSLDTRDTERTIKESIHDGKSSPLYLEEREHRPRTLKEAGIF